jgi:hypothetical protein
MAESDHALSAQDAQTANVRVGGVESRLSASDRLAEVEAQLAAHVAIFKEREKAEQQAQVERQLAAAAVQQALQEAASASAKALEAALKNADELEKERVARVRDEVKEVKASADLAVRAAGVAQDKFETGVKERFSQVNEFRGSLDDLGKSMGTRRELETLRDSIKVATDSLGREVGELRSRIDIGPKDLRALQSRSEQLSGRQERGKEITAYIFSAVTVVVSLTAVLVTLLTH